MNRPLVVNLTGNPNIPTLKLVNVRPMPRADAAAVLFQALVGTRGLVVLDVRPDETSNGLNGKVYQWFKVRFPSGIEGWVRDDLASLEGDGRPYGYPDLTVEVYAFSTIRLLLPTLNSAIPIPQPAPVPVTPPPPAPTPASIPVPVTPPAPIPVSVPVPPIPAPVPVPPSPPITPVPTTREVIGTVIAQGGLNMRQAPVSGAVITRLTFKSTVTILETAPQGAPSNYTWARVQTPSGSGWVRSDNLSIAGDGSALNLSEGDEYPAPMRTYWWIRGFNLRNNPNEEDHLGWDFASNVGEPMLAGPLGGRVMRTFVCTRCTPDKPSTLSQGLSLGDTRVFLDPAWGFGYGNAVIVRYLNEQLPPSTRDRLAGRGLSGAHLYVIYAHLAAINVTVGSDVQPSGVIGACGNTGNSSGAHLHLEMRASFKADDTDWTRMRPNLLDPGVLFLR